MRSNLQLSIVTVTVLLSACKPPVVALSAGSDYACVATQSGKLFCWGSVRVNQDVSTSSNSTVGTGEGVYCVSDPRGSLSCSGYNGFAQLGMVGRSSSALVTIPQLSNPVQVVAGQAHFCARTNTGEVYCWGGSTVGQTGSGPSIGGPCNGLACQPTPLRVPLPTTARSITAGPWHSCAALTNGELYCWGLDGDIPTEPTGNYAVHRVSTFTDIEEVVSPMAPQTTISPLSTYVCVRRSGGSVYCWGTHPGCGAFAIPTIACNGGATAIPGLTDATQLAAGPSHTCAIRTDRTVWCWGDNTSGQRGINPALRIREPNKVNNISDAVQIVVGNNFGCARTSLGQVHCWGALGDPAL